MQLPILDLASWQPTRDTLQLYAKALGKIRRALTPPQKHWWHISLRLTATGLTTTPLLVEDQVVELQLDCLAHTVRVLTSRAAHFEQPLGRGESIAQGVDSLLQGLAQLGVVPTIDHTLFSAPTPLAYDPVLAEAYFQALVRIDGLFKQFQHSLRQETGPVQLWPHHFDLAMLWLSGRLVPGQDPDNAEYADEQMNFGFATGDLDLPEAYFYITAYPAPRGWGEEPLPAPARWHRLGWTGALLTYADWRQMPDPAAGLLNFWQTTQQMGARLMRQSPSL